MPMGEAAIGAAKMIQGVGEAGPGVAAAVKPTIEIARAGESMASITARAQELRVPPIDTQAAKLVGASSDVLRNGSFSANAPDNPALKQVADLPVVPDKVDLPDTTPPKMDGESDLGPITADDVTTDQSSTPIAPETPAETPVDTTPPGTPEVGTGTNPPDPDASLTPKETPPSGQTENTNAAKPPQADAPQKLTNPGEFDEAKTRADIERNNQGLPKDEIDRKVTEARKSHTANVEAYNKQQSSRSPEQIRDEYTDRLQKGEKLTRDEIQELNDAKVAIKEKKELADFETRMKDPNDHLNEEEMARYQDLKNKSEGSALPEGSEKLTLEEQSQQVIDKLRNGEGNPMQNILQLEDLQRQLTLGEKLSKSMRQRFADALESYIEGGNLDNDEAERVIDKIGELYGLEMQLSQLPEQYKMLETQADEIDKRIDQGKKVKFDKSKQSQQRRLELYNNYMQLTMVEAQMVQMSNINAELGQRFNTIMNQIDYSLGRKNIFSYALKGTANAAQSGINSFRRPSLKSTRHRGFLGIAGTS